MIAIFRTLTGLLVDWLFLLVVILLLNQTTCLRPTHYKKWNISKQAAGIAHRDQLWLLQLNLMIMKLTYGWCICTYATIINHKWTSDAKFSLLSACWAEYETAIWRNRHFSSTTAPFLDDFSELLFAAKSGVGCYILSCFLYGFLYSVHYVLIFYLQIVSCRPSLIIIELLIKPSPHENV